MTHPSEELKSLQRRLLASELEVPGQNPNDGRGPPIEVPRRLGTLLPTLAESVFDANFPEQMADSFGEDWEITKIRYEQLYKALILIGRTGEIDRDLLRDGIAAVEIMRDGVRANEEIARSGLSSTDPRIHHAGLYFSYLCLSCDRAALEMLRDGLSEIGRVVDSTPPLPGRP